MVVALEHFCPITGHLHRTFLGVNMESDQIAGHVLERLGMEVQAASLVRARARGAPTPRVWAVMTEHGHFWLVEDGATVELFRAVPPRATFGAFAGCTTAAEAGRRFLQLHPTAHTTAPPVEVEAHQPAGADDLSFACRTCGVWVTRRRRTDSGGRQLCKRCRHAERERLRYHDDPQYRARRLAYSASRYRHGSDSDDGQTATVRINSQASTAPPR